MLEELVARISKAVAPLTSDYEIILVNDGSPDASWEGIKTLCARDTKVKGINLAHNFGQPYAITAGLSYAQGDYIAVIDCDLQNKPEDLPALFLKAMEGYDIVSARRVHRDDTFLKRMSSAVFHRVYDFLSGFSTDKAVAEFGVYSKRIVKVYCSIPEYSRSFVELIHTLGFRKTGIDVMHDHRLEGKSSYNLTRLLRLSFNAIISNSNRPLQLAVTLGFIMSLFSFLMAVYNIFAKFAGWNEVAGYTTTVFSIWFVGGLLLFMMGILGLYIGKIFDQVKGRPVFIVQDTLNI
ncbi:MAG: glycosyltransferase family 2 protein [Bacteroidaceae bacterium]|nr:glycosyltransferase family 2 protein [Bacteroidaceae bacterium]MBR6819643.1 glycosyltransferase family 2 protein [Bacteroidaceae bacterium]MBR7052055.1 glycosyltransferase family 2 protein [Bacteroidaceae bacterium]